MIELSSEAEEIHPKEALCLEEKLQFLGFHLALPQVIPKQFAHGSSPLFTVYWAIDYFVPHFGIFYTAHCAFVFSTNAIYCFHHNALILTFH